MENWEKESTYEDGCPEGGIDEEALTRARSKDPDERYSCALKGVLLEELIQDPCWLVRHTARRAMRREELIERGAFPPGLLENFPCLDISDVVYVLYKEHWRENHTSHFERMRDIREWGRDLILALHDPKIACAPTYEDALLDAIYSGRYYMSHGEFCGYRQPENLGLYQNRAFVEKLLEGDKFLLAAYDASINDAYVQENGVDQVLKNAVARSEETGSQGRRERHEPIYE